MQPLSLAEMRESLRRQGLQALKGRGPAPLQPSSRLNVLPCNRSGADSAAEVASLRRQLREMEDERTAFLQEGVFDLVKFLCGQGGASEPGGASEGAWASQVISAVECLRQHEDAKMSEENAKLRKALETVGECANMDEVREVVHTVLEELSSD